MPLIVDASKASKPQLILIYLSSIHLLCEGSKPTHPRSLIYNSTHACVVCIEFLLSNVLSNKYPFIYLAGISLYLAELINI